MTINYIKAGDSGIRWNHNETRVKQRPCSLTVRTGVKAGPRSGGDLDIFVTNGPGRD